MKVLCLILLLANVVLFVLGNWFGGDSVNPPREEINAKKMQRLDPNELPSAPDQRNN